MQGIDTVLQEQSELLGMNFSQCLEIFGVCRKRGNNMNLRNDVRIWAQTDGLKMYFNSGSNINLSRSRYTSSYNRQSDVLEASWSSVQ